MEYETLLYEKEGQVAVVVLNRPKQLNALSLRMKEELGHVFDEIEKDAEVKVAVLTGGEKAFSAGADIKERATQQMTQAEFYFERRKSHEFYCKIENCEKPVMRSLPAWMISARQSAL